MKITPQLLACIFHEAYERHAPTFGYETRPDTREFDQASVNGQLMVATCRDVIAFLKDAGGELTL